MHLIDIYLLWTELQSYHASSSRLLVISTDYVFCLVRSICHGCLPLVSFYLSRSASLYISTSLSVPQYFYLHIKKFIDVICILLILFNLMELYVFFPFILFFLFCAILLAPPFLALTPFFILPSYTPALLKANYAILFLTVLFLMMDH